MEPSAPAVGARVLLSGLQVCSDLNGKYGVVTGLDMTRLRARVKIEGSGEQNQEAGAGAGAGAGGDVQVQQPYCGGGGCRRR